MTRQFSTHAMTGRTMTGRMMTGLALTGALLLCTACATRGIGGPPLRHDLSAQISTITDSGDEDGTLGTGTALSIDAEGTCWARERVTAGTESTADQGADPAGMPELVRPKNTVKAGQIIRFPTPCPEVMDSEFIATLQRALQVRGYYPGQPSGQMDAATHNALRAYQAPRGLPSGTLSVGAAREMGLIITPLDAL